MLRAPHVASLWAASAVARMPIGINGLAIVLAMRRETGSFAAAGAAAGAFAAAVGLTAPPLGRLVDRHGPRATMVPLALAHGAALVLFVALLSTGAVWALVVLCAIAGAAVPPISPALRAMWDRLLADRDLMTTAFALDAAIVEGVFIAGPLFVAAAVAAASPQAALLVAVALALAGTAAFCASPAVRGWQPERAPGRGLFGALRSPGLRSVVIATAPLGMSFGAIEIALPAFARQEGRPGLAGLLIALWGVGSMAGALAYGARSWQGALGRRWLALTGVLALATFLPLAAASPGAMMVLLLPCGAFIAPSIAAGSQLMGLLAPPGMTTEAYAWGPTALVAGIAAGNAVAGALAQGPGWRAAVLFAGAAALLAAATAYARRRTLAVPAPVPA